MNLTSSTIIEGVRIFYPTATEPMPAPDQNMPSFAVRVNGGWYWLYVFNAGDWMLAYEHPFPSSAVVIMAAIRYVPPPVNDVTIG
ncbi:Uncharacterised protein [Serratia ficaria]|nr:Uncharacterised protein [Serratia ficaria]